MSTWNWVNNVCMCMYVSMYLGCFICFVSYCTADNVTRAYARLFLVAPIRAEPAGINTFLVRRKLRAYGPYTQYTTPHGVNNNRSTPKGINLRWAVAVRSGCPCGAYPSCAGCTVMHCCTLLYSALADWVLFARLLPFDLYGCGWVAFKVFFVLSLIARKKCGCVLDPPWLFRIVEQTLHCQRGGGDYTSMHFTCTASSCNTE